MPTSVAFHVLRGLQQKLFIEYHRFTQHKQANPSQPQHVVGLFVKPNQKLVQPTLPELFVLPGIDSLPPFLKDALKLSKTDNQPYCEQKVNLN